MEDKMNRQDDNMGYLKQYVQQHSDNQMAWYLLGKQYMIEGKEAKANYCFLQAGSIYEAYERKRHPLAQEPQHIIAVWNRKRRMRSLLRRSAVLAVLLVATMLANPWTQMSLKRAEIENEVSRPASGVIPVAKAESGTKVVFVKPAEALSLGPALSLLLGGVGGGNSKMDKGLIVELEHREGWRHWSGSTRLLMAVQQEKGGASLRAQMLDAKACSCQPSDASEAFREWESWSGLQEQRWTLTSGIQQYRELFNKWPDKLEDLVRPYPNNMLAGETAEMKQMFPALLNALKVKENDAKGAAAGKTRPTAAEQAEAASLLSGRSENLPVAPLAIIVDTKVHTLAVVSGDVIVRSYRIGLGGDKTPSGSFYISEKVKNPNGRDDGEFGSRGMTLSGTRYAIHGTNEPASIGKDESLGCVRMGKEDVEELYDLVPLGTKVEIKNDVLPAASKEAGAGNRFRLQPMQNETNPAVVYRWL